VDEKRARLNPEASRRMGLESSDGEL